MKFNLANLVGIVIDGKIYRTMKGTYEPGMDMTFEEIHQTDQNGFTVRMSDIPNQPWLVVKGETVQGLLFSNPEPKD